MNCCNAGNTNRARHSLAADPMEPKLHLQRRSNGQDAVDGRRSHIRPRPGRRRALFSATTLQTLLSITFLLVAVCAPSMAEAAAARLIPREPGSHADLTGYTPIGETSEEILYDRSEAPEPELYKRQLLDIGSTASSAKEKATSTAKSEARSTSSAAISGDDFASPTASAAASTTDSGIESQSTSATSGLPKPFDGGLGTNYTQPSCPDFLKNMINNDTFTSCLPFSVLLQNSMSFFVASRSIPGITQTLTASCNVVSPACSSLMSSYALSLRSPSSCSDDFNRQNPIVRQAYNGLLAYDVLYRASCLHSVPSAANNQSSDYCFADAVTNASSPTNSYIYYLPLGIPLPAGSQPSCDQCLKDTMATLESQAGNQSQPISLTYAAGAQLVNQQCGPNFVNQSVPNAGGNKGSSSSAAPRMAAGVSSGWLGVAVAVAVGIVALL